MPEMSQMSQAPLPTCDTTIEQMVERIASDTAELENRLAWAEILVKVRETGQSQRRASELRALIWTARKRNAALNRASKTGGSR
jgi:hypothetical protein